MLSQNAYFIDLNTIYDIFLQNIWYVIKLLIVGYIAFYMVPTKIFPQEHTGRGVQKIVFNFIYMTAYIEIVVTFLIFIKAFSIALFIFSLIVTKLAFLKWYYKKELIPVLNTFKINVMMWFFNFLDKTREFKNNSLTSFGKNIVHFIKSLTFYKIMTFVLFFAIFSYIVMILMTRGLYSYSNPVADTAQFIDWVGYLQHNILYADHKTAGADFYGISIMIFFVKTFTNIDIIILFSLYPMLLIFALYLSIYYIIKDFSNSRYVAIFAVMFHGIVLMSPVSDIFLGKVVTTLNPDYISFYNFHIYIPKTIDVIKSGLKNGYVPYIRYISGMAYEHSSIFVLLNAYFLIKTLLTKSNIYLTLYTLTLMLVFTFHGGGAIVLIVISILIAINALIFKKIDLKILKKGSLGILFASIAGNMWILSMLKYGIPQDFGAAAPIFDKLLGTKRNTIEITKKGIEALSIVNITFIHILSIVILSLEYIFSFFTKDKFLNSSFLLIPVGIFILYFGPNLGLPMLTSQSRLAEYMFFAYTLMLSFFYYFFFYKPIFILILPRKIAIGFIITVSYIIFIIFTLTLPRWIDTTFFWKNINAMEYTSISNIILKINDENQPFSWTIVSYVQEYAKVKNKGYHINTQNFLLRYNPAAKELKIQTPKIYLFVENFPNRYKGKGEWYYRWRSQIQNDLKGWIALYSANHSNIRVYYKTKTVTVYEIDNSKYVNYIKKLEREKRVKGFKR